MNTPDARVVESRSLVVACDGTSNEFGLANTNVVRLIQCLDRSPDRQLIYYDPGVGTFPEPGFVSRLGKSLSMIAGLAFGGGLDWKVREAYQFLMNYWRPGDRVFLYGFSRGAYTVRVLAAFLHMFGLLPSGNESLLPYAYRLFKASRRRLGKDDDSSKKFWFLVTDYRETFAREVPGQPDRRFPVEFLGVWDTVSSVGWVWDPMHYPYTAKNPGVRHVRHAVSVDERRWFFRQNLFDAADGQDLKECWFPGVHGDVGGGYPVAQGGLWQQPLRWMLEESKLAGFATDPKREAQMWQHGKMVASPWLERQHESLTWKWWPAELFPKMQYWPLLKMSVPAVGLGGRRYIKDGAIPHPSTLRRMRESSLGYNPPNAPGGWRDMPIP